MRPDEVIIRRSLIEPLPWRVRLYPQRARTARGTWVHENLVALAVHHPPILDTLRRIARVDRLQAALRAYARAADASVEILGLEHRRDLLAPDRLPMPTEFNRDHIVSLAERGADEPLAVAAAVLHVTLDLPLYATAVQASLDRIPPLRPARPWLVPSLLRWLHVRYYEALFGPFATVEDENVVPVNESMGAIRRQGQDKRDPWQVPPEWEDLAVVNAPGPRRRLADRAPRRDAGQFTLLQQTRAWWAVRVEQASQREVARRWHRRIEDKLHRAKHGSDANVADCGCLKVVRTGVREVSRLIAAD